MNKLTLFSQIFVFCLSLNVFLPHPSPIPIHTFKVLASLHTVPKTIMSYNYITLNLVKFISLTFLWVLFLTHNVSLVKVKFVKFWLNLSLCSKCPEVMRSSSPPFQFLLYLYTFLTLFEPSLLFLVLDEIIDLSFPSLNYIVNLQKTFYFTFHRSCFLTFKYLTRLIVTSTALFLQIPFATLSDWGEIESGVPQGSVLGPLLFLIYINDLEIGIKSHIKFFADDTSLFSIVGDPNTSACELSHDLKLISQWALQWKMSFKPDPTKQAVQVLFSRKTRRIAHPEIFFNDTQVKTVNEHKHLGLPLDTKLTFASHIDDKLKKARKGLGIIKTLSSYLSVKTLDQIYKMYVRPHLDFCDVIYHLPCITDPFDSSINLKYLMNTLEIIQYHCALAITGAWQGTNLDKIYDQLGWESLTDRRYCRRLFHFYKIQNDLTPSYMKDPLPPLKNHPYTTRSEFVLHELKCHSDSFRNSFYPDRVRCWNRLDHLLRDSPNIQSFKKRIFADYRPPPRSLFGIHDSLGIRRLFQLRVGLSPLLEHKNNHNFLDTPSDKCITCNRTENLEHFFLYCARFVSPRRLLFTSIQSLNINFELLEPRDKIKFLLYGDSSLDLARNKLLLKATLKFVADTERFS